VDGSGSSARVRVAAVRRMNDCLARRQLRGAELAPPQVDGAGATALTGPAVQDPAVSLAVPRTGTAKPAATDAGRRLERPATADRSYARKASVWTGLRD
jgi:hypothetical protein